LTETVIKLASPEAIYAVDASKQFVDYASQRITDQRVRFDVADAYHLPGADGIYDVVVSGLMLNFLPQPDRALTEMVRVTAPGGTVGVYVWDYRDGMQMLRYFWDTALELNRDAKALDESERFPLCQRQPLLTLFEGVGLRDVEVTSIEVDMHFQDFGEFWTPFLGGQGPAPDYCMSLDNGKRTALRNKLRDRLPVNQDGSIDLTAVACAVRGQCP
jgi:SAM-dependent methyltransferase